MTISKNNILQRTNNKPIVFDIFCKDVTKKNPLVIFCHGYKGFKDWGAWDGVAKAFAEAGFAFVKFNFSHNGGTVEQPIDFPDLEAFAQNNYSKELEDVEDIINHLLTHLEYNKYILEDSIQLIGHSRGGGIVLIKAKEDIRIKKVATWAGVSDYKSRFLKDNETFTNWKKNGRMFVENGRTRQKMPHDWQFYEDFVANEERLTIEKAVKALTIPLLIIHGNDDISVPFKEAEKLHQWNPQGILTAIKEANHVFGACHPWNEETLPEQLEEVVKKTISFLK